ncbi:MAG: Hsp70 family protein [Desulfobacteraceae bacterium]|nr:MAG: Hsp70 family protein [Desulfobacteraceae bacterium]
MKEPKYIIGIDLGTTNSVLAYTGSQVPEGEEPRISVFPALQIVEAGQAKARNLLPSFLFLASSHDVPEGSLSLPWSPENTDFAVGEFARKRGAELPFRLVSSAKSWLCHNGVDRTRPILPWDSPPEVQRVSPMDASSRFLEHFREAWNHEMAAEGPEARLEDQEIYLTVPASFDAVARELTAEAARAAGFLKLTLLEEPQAAFYAWIESQAEKWRKSIKVGQSILVCDVGGGTTDFSLIQVSEEDGELVLKRVAVGDHILLGGDNMDIALAYMVRGKLAAQGTRLDNWQFRGLWQSCRTAKERLLNDPSLDKEPVVILGRGSSLIARTIRTELTRKEIETAILEGFFPKAAITDFPKEQTRVGMREMGLPYEADPAITRHLARFLSRQVLGSGGEGSVAFPTTVLFNGGVMKSPLLRERLLDVLRNWEGQGNVAELSSVDLDLGVAKGAAYYGLAKRGRGVRVRGGAPRSYYIGIETSMPSVPGVPTPMKALCVVPFGMEEGTEAELRGREFGLLTGEQAQFHLFASTVRKDDHAGEVVEDWSEEIEPVTVMETLLPAADTEGEDRTVPVWLKSIMTEVGTLELWCVSRDEERKWKLEFNLREQEKQQ